MMKKVHKQLPKQIKRLHQDDDKREKLHDAIQKREKARRIKYIKEE